MEKTATENDLDYAAVFRSLPSPYLLIAPDAPIHTVLDASDAYLKLTKRPREQVVGLPISSAFPNKPNAPLAYGLAKVRQALTTVMFTRMADTIDLQAHDVRPLFEEGVGVDKRFWRAVHVPVFASGGELLYIVQAMSDVTGRMLSRNGEQEAVASTEETQTQLVEYKNRVNKLLKALSKYKQMDFSLQLLPFGKKDALDGIVEGVNALISELSDYIGRLTKVNQELEYANKELDSFSYSVSHDLRAPLRAIDGYAQVLLEDHYERLDADGRNTIDTILRNTKRMATFIDDLLTFSRLGKQVVNTQRLNMNDLAHTVVRQLIDHRNEKRTEISVADLPPVDGDGSLLKQAFENLVSNALKYSGRKQKSCVNIGGFRRDGAVVYFVKDNGAGFDMKHYHRLFGVFQRLHSDSEFEGTGIGLALVQRIVKKHGGEVWAEAVPEQGATFYFSIPFEPNHY